MTEIPLTRGKVALVDDADVPLVATRKWQARPRNGGNGWYARAMDYTKVDGRLVARPVWMHRLLLPGVPLVDHKNGDGLDNQRSTGNLRPATGTQNNANMAKTRGSSRYKGVSWHRQGRCWAAAITCNRKHQHLGRFRDEADAARAYNEAALRLWGEYARLNVIEAAS